MNGYIPQAHLPTYTFSSRPERTGQAQETESNESPQENVSIRIGRIFPEGIQGWPGLNFSIQDVSYTQGGKYSKPWEDAVTSTYQEYGWIPQNQGVDFNEGDRGLILYLQENNIPLAAVGGVRALYGRLNLNNNQPVFEKSLFVSNFNLALLQDYREVVHNDVHLPDGIEEVAPAVMHALLTELATQPDPNFSELAKLFHATTQVLHLFKNQPASEQKESLNENQSTEQTESAGKNEPTREQIKTLIAAMRVAKTTVLSTLGEVFNNKHVVAYVRGKEAAAMFVELNKGRPVYAAALPSSDPEIINREVRNKMPGYFFKDSEDGGKEPKDITLLISPRRS